jgi:hypothetical protein
MSRASQMETVFTLTIDAQDIKVRYRPYFIDGRDPYAILEFSSPHQPRRPISVSTTGYRSFFAPMDEIEAAPSIQKYASMVVLVLAGEVVQHAESADQRVPL